MTVTAINFAVTGESLCNPFGTDIAVAGRKWAQKLLFSPTVGMPLWCDCPVSRFPIPIQDNTWKTVQDMLR